ncbi:MAG: tetratricopeptide repeat protein [Burkholderiales bacterium]|nr:tetratricopeptide repeat protein [Burkholderiales bacterium]
MSDDATANATAALTTLQQALALHQGGQLAQAQALYDRVLQWQPENFDALHLSGLIAFQSKNPARAVELINRALAVNPDHADAHANMGNALRKLGQFESALASYDTAIRLRPEHAESHFNRGIALKELGQYALAVSSYDQAIALNPGLMPAYANRGVALAALDRHESAIASFDHAINLKPGIAYSHLHRGISLHAMGRYPEAAASYRQAIALEPANAEAHHNLGISLIQLRQHEAAIASIDRAIALKPGFAEAYVNRALAFHEIRQHQAAMADYRQAIALQPKLRIAHRNLSHLHLLLGDYEQGWEEFEWRLRGDDGEDRQGRFSQPLWLGRESLAGKTILLHSEQGLGDTIQFCRYAKLVADLGARVILEVQKPLLKLFANLDGVALLVSKGGVLPPFQFHCPLMSLPLAFRTRLDNIPAAGGYLRADAGKIEAWRARLGTKTKPRVGLVWSGNPLQKNNHNRSIPLAVLTGLLDSQFEYVSLQKEANEADRKILGAHPAIRCFELDDLSDTAALCELLDLVISVDTSVAHLTGALGRPVWIPLGFNADWRYLLERADSPWYASARLYREDRLKGWNEVVANIRADLMRLFAAAGQA